MTELAHTVEEALTRFRLVEGIGDGDTTACPMSALNWIRYGDGRWNDAPECAHPLIRGVVIGVCTAVISDDGLYRYPSDQVKSAHRRKCRARLSPPRHWPNLTRRSDVPDTTVFRPVSGWPGYRVSDDGTVWSCRNSHAIETDTWHPLSPRPDRDGYLSVTLNLRGRRQTVKVAHLVLAAFVGPRPDGAEAAHWPDPDVRNNAAPNLRWTQHHDTTLDKVRGRTVARGEGHPAAKLTEDDVRAIRLAYRPGERGFGYISVGRRYGTSGNQVRLIVTRQNWSHIL